MSFFLIFIIYHIYAHHSITCEKNLMFYQKTFSHPYSHYIMEFVICTKYYVIPTAAIPLAFYIEYSFNRSINSPHVLTTSLPSRCFRYIPSCRLLLASHFTFHIILLIGISSGNEWEMLFRQWAL